MRSDGKIKVIVICLFIGYQFLYGPELYGLPEFLLRFSQDPLLPAGIPRPVLYLPYRPPGTGPRKPFGAAFEKKQAHCDAGVSPSLAQPFFTWHLL